MRPEFSRSRCPFGFFHVVSVSYLFFNLFFFRLRQQNFSKISKKSSKISEKWKNSFSQSIVEYMGESVDVHINSYTYFDIPCTLISYVDECRYVRGNVDTSSLAGDTAFAYDTSSVNTHEKHDSPRSRNSDISRKVKSTRALEKNITYIHTTIHPKLCI